MSNTNKGFNSIEVDVATMQFILNGNPMGYIEESKISPKLDTSDGQLRFTVTFLAREVNYVDSSVINHENKRGSK